jgi:N-glycosylase/DNA lyase
MAFRSPDVIERAVLTMSRRVKDELAASRVDWRRLTEEALWGELSGCILGSGVSYAQARTATRRLLDTDLARPWEMPLELPLLTSSFEKALRGSRPGTGYRYPYARARSLAITVARIYGEGRSIKIMLADAGNASQARRQLVRVVHGVGPKQASLFLVNVGYGDGLAILDRHVIAFLRITGRYPGRNAHISSLSSYEQLERDLLCYAHERGVDASAFDLAVWLIMRQHPRKGEEWN